MRIDDYDLHFVHVRGRGPDPLPLILTNGWPSSIHEYAGVVGPLTDPAAHGGDEADAFDVVIPALPGYPFSRAPDRVGTWPEVPGLWRRLMTDVLGYPRFVASGGDLGAMVTAALGALHADVVDAIQLMAVFGSTTLDDPTLSADERRFLDRAGRVGSNGGRLRAPAGHEAADARVRTQRLAGRDCSRGSSRSTARGRTAAACSRAPSPPTSCS